MKVKVKCFATLSDQYPCDYRQSSTQELADGQTVEDLLEKERISKEKVKIVFVNGKKAHFDTVLGDGDQIGLAPAIGGM